MTPTLCHGVEGSTCAASYVGTVGTLAGDRVRVSDVSAANVFKTTAYSNFSFAADNNSYTLTAGAENKDFVYDADTKFIVATYDNRTGVKSAVLTEGSYANLDANDVVLAVYSTTPITVPGVTVANLYTAKYVYILKASTEDINVPTTAATMTLTKDPMSNVFTATLTQGTAALSGVDVYMTVTTAAGTGSPVKMAYASNPTATSWTYQAIPSIATLGSSYTITATAYMGSTVVATATFNVA